MKLFLFITLLVPVTIFGGDLDSAKSLFDSGEYLKSANNITEAIKADSSNAELYAFASKVFFKLDKLDESYQYIFKAIELDKKNEEFRQESVNLMEIKEMITDARRSSDSGYFEEAIENYNKISRKIPDFALPYFLKGMEYYHQSDFDSAVENIKIAIEKNKFEERYSTALNNIAIKLYNEGKESFGRKNYDEAILKFQDALRVKPDFVEARFKLAYSHYKINDFDTAITLLKENHAYDPEDYQGLKLLGDAYQKIHDTENAISSYKDAIQVNENYDRAYYSLGKLYYSNGDMDNSIDILTKAIQVSPNYGKAYELLGTAYQSVEKPDAAIKYYLLAIDNSKKSYSLQYRIASAYNLIQDFENARSHAKLSIEYKNNYAPAYFELGLAEKCLGNKIAALDAFKKASSDKDWRKPSQHEIKYIDKSDCK